MKKTPLKKKSKSAKKVLETRLWELCKIITRIKHGNVCYTCGKGNLSGSNWHTGHMWAKASLSNHLKYDLRVLRPQCYHCNINLGGMGAVFFEKMQKELGDSVMKDLIEEKQILIKADEIWFNNKINEYEEIFKNIRNTPSGLPSKNRA